MDGSRVGRWVNRLDLKKRTTNYELERFEERVKGSNTRVFTRANGAIPVTVLLI